MDNNIKGRFYLENFLNDASKQYKCGDLYSAVYGKYFWEFKKPSVKQPMYGELSTLYSFPLDQESITEIFQTPLEELELLCEGNYFWSNEESKRTLYFSDGHLEEVDGHHDDEHHCLFEQAKFMAKKSLRRFSELYKTRLKSSHIKNLKYINFTHNLSNPLGKELFLEMHSEHFTKQDPTNPNDTTKITVSMDEFMESFAHTFETLN
ncbi:hypothetical protein OAJ98_02230 [Deltaproteobacteria bacterium]|nr:hypothetical protein [Deltaproteobacteria bacterium]